MLKPNFNKDDFKSSLQKNIKMVFRKTLDTASKKEIYQGAVYAVRDVINDIWLDTHDRYYEKDDKIVYYLSMEFLMGRFFGNALLNISALEPIKEVFDEIGFNYNEIEEEESDPGLGNGGLGRLAVCFLDSLSTLGFPAYGCGIRYHYGIFEQKIQDGYQIEKPDNWLKGGDPWCIKRDEYAVEVKFGGSVSAVLDEHGEYKFVQEGYQSVMAIPYDYPVIGYNNNIVNTLRLWDASPKNELDLQSFNDGDYQKSLEEKNLATILTNVLYPADEHYSGKELRLKQQYFFISATVQRVVERFKKNHTDFSVFPSKVAFQLNDTHPTVAVAELMRVLVDENNVPWDNAWDITKKVCAYTNHTIMSEALEKWPIELFSKILPRIYMIVEEINRRFLLEVMEKYNDPSKAYRMAIIANGQVKMAYLAIAGSHSVNGVAALHTKILKEQELKEFYDLYPEKFNNKTNGITQRRWLLHANPQLAKLITSKIGDKWITDLSELSKLMKFAGDEGFRNELVRVKMDNKKGLVKYIKGMKGIDINPDSIFDVQIKRLHEYKRQLLNVLHIIYLYNCLKENPELDIVPRTFIFGAKSAASYKKAKLIIKLINSVADVVNNDLELGGKIKVVFMENYRVSLAEMLIPAADVSEQISTAGKEASGTGNMKFMLNGAVTIGTMDGANVEIYEEVGKENIFIFGMSADDAINKYESGLYDPWAVYNSNQDLRKTLERLIDGTFSKDTGLFREIYDSLLGANGSRGDEYFVLEDFGSYVKAQKKLESVYRDKECWISMSISNIAKSGKFSSDRTILEYAKDIWDLKREDI